MILRTPHYYKNFKCIASECKDNCCIGGWEINIDEETAEYYKSVEGDFGDRLRAAVDYTDEYCFKLNNGKCPFLDDKNLCEIYKELGEDKMGVVCTQFPRFTEYFGDIKETGIGLACEEAARIILSDDRMFKLDISDCDEEAFTDGEYDSTLGKSLFKFRDKLFTMCGLNSLKLTDKLIIMLNTANKLQQLINENDYAAIESFCDEFTPDKYLNDVICASNCDNETDDDVFTYSVENAVARIWYAYLELESLNDDWNSYADRVLETFHPDDADQKHIENYLQYSHDFMVYIEPRINEYNSLIKYYLFRYFMKAAFDHDIVGKIQLVIANFIVIRDMDMLRWLDNNKTFDFQDRLDIVHIFSREVEYSEDNLWTLSEEFMFDDIFNPKTLIKLLSHLSY